MHRLVVHYVRSKGGAITIGELLADPLVGALVRELTVAELSSNGVSPSGAGSGRTFVRVSQGKPPTRAGRRGGTNTRTAEGRGDYDTRVLAAIKAAGGPVAAQQLLKSVGGTGLQFRTATKRLLAGKKIKRSGKARGTRYAAA